MTKYGSYLFITEWSYYFYLFLEGSLRVYIYMDMSNCFITCGNLPAQLLWIITYWTIITTIVIELLYVIKFCFNKEPCLLLWEYNRVILAQSANTGFTTGYYPGYNRYTPWYFTKYICRVTVRLTLSLDIIGYFLNSIPAFELYSQCLNSKISSV